MSDSTPQASSVGRAGARGPSPAGRVDPKVWALLVGVLILAVLVWAIALRDGGDTIPGDAVATVDGTAITKADYEKWAEVTAKGSAQGGAPVVIPDPPTFTRCIATLRSQSRPARGQPRPTDATLRAQCRQRNEGLVQQTMGTLIQNLWIEKEAEDQGLTVTDAEVQRQLAETRRQSFPTEKDYRRFLKQSGMTKSDVLERVRIQALAAKLARKIQGNSASTSAAGQKKMTTFVADFQQRWKDKTNCREGYVVPLCNNAPEPKTAAPTSGAVPSQSTAPANSRPVTPSGQ